MRQPPTKKLRNEGLLRLTFLLDFLACICLSSACIGTILTERGKETVCIPHMLQREDDERRQTHCCNTEPYEVKQP